MNRRMNKENKFLSIIVRGEFIRHYADWYTYFDTQLIRHLTRLRLSQNARAIMSLKAVLFSIKSIPGCLLPSRERWLIQPIYSQDVYRVKFVFLEAIFRCWLIMWVTCTNKASGLILNSLHTQKKNKHR